MGSGRASGSKTAKKKRSRARKNEEEEPTPPSTKRWDEMVSYDTFVVRDNEGKGVKFATGQVVLILPHGFDPQDQHDIVTYWIAKIKGIRKELSLDGSDKVWVKVQWYYSGEDVADVVKSFNPNTMGKYERVFSDHHDYVRPESFEAEIPMYKLDENDCDQPYIPTDSFYRRYNLEYKARNVQPKSSKTTCVCQAPYIPDDEDPLSLIHFCPRPACRRGYHQRCLMGRKSKESSIAGGSSNLTLTTKIPSFPTADRAAVRDTAVVQRSARKRAFPRPKNRLSLRVKQEPHQMEVDAAAQVIQIVFPGSPSSSAGNGNEAAVVVQESHPPLSRPSVTPTTTTTTTQSISLTGRSLRLLACSPDSDETLDLTSLLPKLDGGPSRPDDAMETDDERNDSTGDDGGSDSPSQSSPSRKKHRRRLQRPQRRTTIRGGSGGGSRESLATALSTVPPDLLRVAIQPLVRGGAFIGGGVAGNIGMVTHARRLIYAALQMGGGPSSVPDEWEDLVFGEDRKALKCGVDNAIVSLIADTDHDELDSLTRDAEELPPFVCLNCKSAI